MTLRAFNPNDPTWRDYEAPITARTMSEPTGRDREIARAALGLGDVESLSGFPQRWELERVALAVADERSRLCEQFAALAVDLDESGDVPGAGDNIRALIAEVNAR